MTALDVSNNTSLTYLSCSTNQLTSLDVSTNTALTFLSFYSNELTTIDVSANTVLTSLSCSTNQLTALDVSNNASLTYLSCSTNQLTALDVSASTDLIDLYCDDNQLASLNMSANTALEQFRCQNNQLTYLNMKNGVTEQLIIFNATNNALDCIEVNLEDVDYATTYWTPDNGNIDAGVTFASICLSNPSYTNVPDDNFEQALIDFGYDNVIDDYVLTANISSVTSLDVNNEEISDLTGIEGFSVLDTLRCSNNQLTSLDVSANTALTFLSCYGNQLTSLDMRIYTA